MRGFQVEGEIFHVPFKPFQEDSSAFTEMYHLPEVGSAAVKELDEPIPLHGVTISAFTSFLEVLFTPSVQINFQQLPT